MIMRKVLYFVTGSIFVVSLLFVLLLSDLQLIAFDKDYYERQYEKYQIPQSIGISMPDLMTSTGNLMDYLNGKREDLNFQMPINGVQQEFFSERDKLHMIDVKNLFVNGRLIRNVSFWYCVLFTAFLGYKLRDRRRSFSKLFIYTFVAGVVPIIILVILMNIDFYKYFTIFHELFFNNDLWQLDPAKDRLINMYPEAFFSGIAFKVAFYYIGELVLLLLLGIIGLRYGRRSTLARKR